MALPDFSALVERNGPAVVNISVTGMGRVGRDGGVAREDPMLQFFRRFQGREAPRAPVVRGMGSGFIVSSDGLVLTNAHVVAEAKDVTVRLTDKREFRAKVLGVDRQSDVAVLKIDATGLPVVSLGDVRSVKVGEWVLAIGSPYGFENTVTAGIVSAKARSLPDESFVPFLQTDVAVNPGNSGGPLFNLNGDVIGINSQIFSTTGGFMGLSFAIPIDVAVKVKDELVRYGKVTRGRLGVSIQDLTPDIAATLRLAATRGALVTAVEPGGPAERAGLRPGDVILAINGDEVASATELPARIADLKPGTRAAVRLVRGGRVEEVAVAVAQMRAPPVAAMGPE
jgi:serine protease Do